MEIDNFDVADFLQNVWQQKPLVIRKGFAQTDWLEPDDLAGLACEEGIEARIILQNKGKWCVEHGPFPEQRFSSLPRKNWTLLVQAVDQWVPEVADILKCFNFLPSWRLDDVMVSYAPVGGTVSQHFDFYDVFLIQGEGSRRWQIGQVCDGASVLLPDTPVKILRDFEVSIEVTLNPGDILYIPARFAHYGVSVEDSLTYSVGFRAPGIRDIVDGISTAALECLTDDLRYQDTPDSLRASTGEIPASAVEQVRQMLYSALSQPDLIKGWLGAFVTERKYPDAERAYSEVNGWLSRLQEDVLLRSPGSRFAYMCMSESEQALLFVDGEQYPCSLLLAKFLAEADVLEADRLTAFYREDVQRRCLDALLTSGALVFEADLYD